MTILQLKPLALGFRTFCTLRTFVCFVRFMVISPSLIDYRFLIKTRDQVVCWSWTCDHCAPELLPIPTIPNMTIFLLLSQFIDFQYRLSIIDIDQLVTDQVRAGARRPSAAGGEVYRFRAGERDKPGWEAWFCMAIIDFWSITRDHVTGSKSDVNAGHSTRQAGSNEL